MTEKERKPLGGFCFVAATGLLATWWAYKQRLIEFRDVRVWLAGHELVAQRCRLEEGRLPRFQLSELKALVGGVGGEHLRTSVRRLEAVGLLRWSELSIDVKVVLGQVRGGDTEHLCTTVESVANHKRRIPVPRRLLRLLARESRPVLMATAFGHLLRCMYYRAKECAPSGLCKASWIADTFGVDERNVKAARKELESMGVLIREHASQFVLNRWGVPIRFNLEWEGRGVRCGSPPRKQLSTTQSPPPRETGISSSGRSKNQKPGVPAAVGVRQRTFRAPTLRKVNSADLAGRDRLVVLWHQAQRAGLCNGSESDLLRFVSAAAHARRVGTSNPCGLFATIVRRGLWSYLSSEDEEVARHMVNTLRFSPPAVPVLIRRHEPPADSMDREEVRRLVSKSLLAVAEADRIRHSPVAQEQDRTLHQPVKAGFVRSAFVGGAQSEVPGNERRASQVRQFGPSHIRTPRARRWESNGQRPAQNSCAPADGYEHDNANRLPA